jgi:cytochrome P450
MSAIDSPATNPEGSGSGQEWPVFQMMDPEMIRDKPAFFRSLQQQSPFWWVELPSGPQLDVPKRWLVPMRYQDVRDAHLNPDLHASPAPEHETRDPNDKSVWRRYDAQMQTADPPVHTRRRKLFAKAFTMRRIEKLRPTLETLTATQLGLLEAKGADGSVVDLMTYAWSLPIRLICELLGVPDEHIGPFDAWEERTRVHKGGQMGFDDLAEQVVVNLRELIADKRAEPKDDLLSELIQVQDAEDGRLSEHELISICLSLLVSGHEPTVDLIGNGLAALLSHPEQRDEVRDDPSLLGAAVEEALRFDGAQFVTNPRFAVADTKIGEAEVKKGTVVVLPLGVANHDPEKFDNGDQFDIHRNTSGHLAFGIHHCLGAALARIVGEVCIGRFLERFPQARLAVPVRELRHVPGPLSRTLIELPAVLVENQAAAG